AAAIPLIRKKLFAAAGGSGPEGMFSLALAALDIALWDIAGKAKGEPLWKLVGASGAPVPCYASGAMMRELDLGTSVKAAGRLVERGITSTTFQRGHPYAYNLGADMERARLLRVSAGNEVALMCDVNKRWSLEEERRIAPRLDEYPRTSLEDPIADDVADGL